MDQKNRVFNDHRMATHIISSTFGLAVLYFTSLRVFQFFALSSLLIALFLSYHLNEEDLLKLLFDDFERNERIDLIPAEAAVPIIFGGLLSTFAGEANAVFTGLLLLAYCDPTARFVGRRYGRYSNPLNTEKNIEGTLAATLLGIVLIHSLTGIYSAVLISSTVMLAESLKREIRGFRLDDNIVIPVLAAFLYMMLP